MIKSFYSLDRLGRRLFDGRPVHGSRPIQELVVGGYYTLLQARFNIDPELRPTHERSVPTTRVLEFIQEGDFISSARRS